VRHIFERVVMAAMVMGLVKGEGFCRGRERHRGKRESLPRQGTYELDWNGGAASEAAAAGCLPQRFRTATVMASPVTVALATRWIVDGTGDALLSAGAPRID